MMPDLGNPASHFGKGWFFLNFLNISVINITHFFVNFNNFFLKKCTKICLTVCGFPWFRRHISQNIENGSQNAIFPYLIQTFFNGLIQV